MPTSGHELLEQAEHLYQQYGKPLEKEHWGEYVAIHPDGRFVLDPSQLAALEQALAQFGPGSFLFKVGEKAVGRWRQLRG